MIEKRFQVECRLKRWIRVAPVQYYLFGDLNIQVPQVKSWLEWFSLWVSKVIRVRSGFAFLLLVIG